MQLTPPKHRNKLVVTFTLELKLMERLIARAVEEKRPRSQVVGFALEQYLAQEEV